MASNRKQNKAQAMAKKRSQKAKKAIKKIQTVERALTQKEHKLTGKELENLSVKLSKNIAQNSKRARRRTQQNVMRHANMMNKLRDTGANSKEIRSYVREKFGKDITRLSTFNNNVGTKISLSDIHRASNAKIDGSGSLYNSDDYADLSKDLNKAHENIKSQDLNERLRKRAMDKLPTKSELRDIVKNDGLDAAKNLLDDDFSEGVVESLKKEINESISELRERASFVDSGEGTAGIISRLGLQEMLTVDYESFDETLVEQWQGAIQDAGEPSMLRGLMSISYAILDMKDELN